MTLSWPIALAVVFAAVLHASWNVLVKSGADKPVDTALVLALGGVLALPGVAIAGWPPRAAMPFLAASLPVHVAYYFTLAGAYRHGDLGLTYPIMRGTAPLLVALGSATLIGETPSARAWTGVAGIACGVALVGLSGVGLGAALHQRRALGWALANAAIIAVYTTIDGQGVRAAVAAGRGAASYVMLLAALDGVCYPLLVWWRRVPSGRVAIAERMRQRWRMATLGGAASVGSYAIALWAMTHAPVASVAALRETSVLFGALFGTWVLNERFGTQRALGTAVIVGGVVALRLG